MINAQWKPERAEGESKDNRDCLPPIPDDRQGSRAVLALLLVAITSEELGTQEMQ